MHFKNLIVLSISALCLTACGVKTEYAANNPPVIHKNLVTFAVPFGEFAFALPPSAFLYPASLTEDQAESMVRTMSYNSMVAEKYFGRNALLQDEAKPLSDEWDALDCVRKYAVLGPGDDPDIGVDHVSEWQQPKNDKGTLEIPKCQSNQDTREANKKEMTDNQLIINPLLDEINLLIDPDQNHKVNSRDIDISSTLSILQDAQGVPVVRVRLVNFEMPGYTPSTEATTDQDGSVVAPKITNASYDVAMRSLKFDVPECNSRDADNKIVCSGNVYRFVLERGPNTGPLSVFKGDMNLYDASGARLRYGTASFYAKQK